jgi:hypothetical protein
MQFNVDVAVADRPATDDELDAAHILRRLNSPSLTVVGYGGGWGSGFRLHVRCEADDERSALQAVDSTIVAWLTESQFGGTALPAKIAKRR